MRWIQPIRMFTVIFSLAAVLTACAGGDKETASPAPAQEAAEATADSSTKPSGADTAIENSESNAVEPTSDATETLKELQDQYADKLGYIRIPLDDHPVRRVSEEGSKNINVANYSDTVVDMNAEVPIHANTQRLIDDAFPFYNRTGS